MTPDEILALSDERDLWMARVNDAYRSAWRDGYARGHADRDRELWDHRSAGPPPLVDPYAPTRAELQARRWGPGGRAHFADPRPGDYPGKGIRANVIIRLPAS